MGGIVVEVADLCNYLPRHFFAAMITTVAAGWLAYVKHDHRHVGFCSTTGDIACCIYTLT